MSTTPTRGGRLTRTTGPTRPTSRCAAWRSYWRIPLPASGRRPDRGGGPPGADWITFQNLKWASFAHSTIYAALLASWAAGWSTGQLVYGYAHGIGWFV